MNAMMKEKAKEKNYTVTSTCNLKGKTRSSQITISWPLKTKQYNLSIMFSAVSYHLDIKVMSIDLLINFRTTIKVNKDGK